MHAQYGQCASIDKGHTRAIGELESRALVPRRVVTHESDVPITGHAEVHFQQLPVVEGDELDLRSTRHVHNSVTTKAAHRFCGECPSHGWMKHLNVRNRPSEHRLTE